LDESGILRTATLEKLVRAAEQILAIPGVIAEDVVSLATSDNIMAKDGSPGEVLGQGGDGALGNAVIARGELVIRKFLAEVPRTDEALVQLRCELFGNPFYVGKIISQDGKATALYVPIQDKKLSHKIAGQIEEILKKEFPLSEGKAGGADKVVAQVSQPAVSPTSSRQTASRSDAPLSSPEPAGWKPAIQQVGNLRYHIAVCSTLSLGLSVDFAIHFLTKFREFARRGGDAAGINQELFGSPREILHIDSEGALGNAVISQSETARAIWRNALVITLTFLPMMHAPLTPYVTVGLFFVGLMIASAAATLVLLPALTRLLPTPMGTGRQLQTATT
jgi:hypothetical protein